MLSNFCHCCLRRRLGRLQRQVGAPCTAACRHSRGGDTGACWLSRLYPASTGDDDCLHDPLGSSISGLRSAPPVRADTATPARVTARQSRAWHPNACVSARGRRYSVLDKSVDLVESPLGSFLTALAAKRQRRQPDRERRFLVATSGNCKSRQQRSLCSAIKSRLTTVIKSSGDGDRLNPFSDIVPVVPKRGSARLVRLRLKSDSVVCKRHRFLSWAFCNWSIASPLRSDPSASWRVKARPGLLPRRGPSNLGT